MTLSGHEEPIPDITFSPDGVRIATASQDGTVKIWDAASGKEIITLRGHGSEIQSVVFSTDGKWIATGSGDNSAKIWDAISGKEMLTLAGSLGGVNGVAFRPGVSEPTLAVASTDGIVRVYLLSIDRVIALAKTRLTRSFRPDECSKYLHLAACPVGMP